MILPTDRTCSGSIEVGLLPYFPSFSMWLIDPDRLTGKIIVEIYGHRTAEPNPTFMLVPDRDAQWYAYFRKQFDLIGRPATTQTESCKRILVRHQHPSRERPARSNKDKP